MKHGCAHCGAADITTYHAIGGEGTLCKECARRDILSWLSDCDSQEMAKLRRRAEDCLRKNRGQLMEILITLVIAGAIDYDDCL